MTNKDPLFLLSFCLFLFACSSPEPISAPAPVSVVQAPIPALDPIFEQVRFSVAEGKTWRLDSGTSIEIPANAFVDQDGKQLSGEIEMQYRELQDAFDIYLSGIPLAAEGGNLSTAGTFEIQAQQAGVNVFVKDSTAIKVRMASFTGGDDYDFYQLDEYSGNWANKGTAAPEVNIERKKVKRKIRRLRPSVRFPLNSKYMAFNYQAILDIYFNNDWKKMKEDQGVPSQMKKYGLGWNEAQVHQKIKWENEEIPGSLMVWKNLSKKAFPDWSKDTYGKLEKITGNQYQYHMANKDSSAFFSTRLLAVMPLKTLFAFPPEKWKNDYEATMAKVYKEQERLKTMAEVYRTFEVQEMGIYNWDRLVKMEESVLLSADFSVSTEDPLAELTMIYISGDNRMVVKFPKEKWPDLNLLEDKKGRIFCLLSAQKIALYPASEYQKIDFDALRKAENPKHHFEMKNIDLTINSRENLIEALAIVP